MTGREEFVLLVAEEENEGREGKKRRRAIACGAHSGAV